MKRYQDEAPPAHICRQHVSKDSETMAYGPSHALFEALQQRYTRGTHLFVSTSRVADTVIDATRSWTSRP